MLSADCYHQKYAECSTLFPIEPFPVRRRSYDFEATSGGTTKVSPTSASKFQSELKLRDYVFSFAKIDSAHVLDALRSPSIMLIKLSTSGGLLASA